MLGLQVVHAQEDSLRENKIDSLLKNRKGLLGQFTRSLLTDSVEKADLQRTDRPFQRYAGRIIRNIYIQHVDFGESVGDTGRAAGGRLASLANSLHRDTEAEVVRKNLFFREGEALSPFLMGNNDRFLRDLPYLQFARIRVRPALESRDSVDIIVVTKDVFSLGGDISLHSASAATVEVAEDNFMGRGDRLQLQTHFDRERHNRFGFGAEYTHRNLRGSFVDASAGYLNFNNTFNTRRAEEKLAFLRMVRPLINPFMRWTYALQAEWHGSSNMFGTDSLYRADWRYSYLLYDAWAGWNLSAQRVGNDREYHRLRFLLSARLIDQKFLSRPEHVSNNFFFSFADLTALLGAVTVYKQNFYKTAFIYGFGRNEDVPGGFEATLTSGVVTKDGRKRTYLGMKAQLGHITNEETFFNYTLAFGSSLYKKTWEDLNMLAAVDYFSRLRQLNAGWKQRWFMTASITKQYNHVLDEPLVIESQYGQPDYQNNLEGGHLRISGSAESVFYSPWNLLYFRFAPFVFAGTTLFKVGGEAPKTLFVPSIGGGIRTRNESLVFGTIELKGLYYPRKDFFSNNFEIQFNTNLRYKYNQNFIRRPEFVRVN